MAETNSLLNCRTEQSVPGVRIPPSPQATKEAGMESAYGGFFRYKGSELVASYKTQTPYNGKNLCEDFIPASFVACRYPSLGSRSNPFHLEPSS